MQFIVRGINMLHVTIKITQTVTLLCCCQVHRLWASTDTSRILIEGAASGLASLSACYTYINQKPFGFLFRAVDGECI